MLSTSQFNQSFAQVFGEQLISAFIVGTVHNVNVFTAWRTLQERIQALEKIAEEVQEDQDETPSRKSKKDSIRQSLERIGSSPQLAIEIPSSPVPSSIEKGLQGSHSKKSEDKHSHNETKETKSNEHGPLSFSLYAKKNTYSVLRFYTIPMCVGLYAFSMSRDPNPIGSQSGFISICPTGQITSSTTEKAPSIFEVGFFLCVVYFGAIKYLQQQRKLKESRHVGPDVASQNPSSSQEGETVTMFEYVFSLCRVHTETRMLLLWIVFVVWQYVFWRYGVGTLPTTNLISGFTLAFIVGLSLNCNGYAIFLKNKNRLSEVQKQHEKQGQAQGVVNQQGDQVRDLLLLVAMMMIMIGYSAGNCG